jgi:hypothetical protein
MGARTRQRLLDFHFTTRQLFAAPLAHGSGGAESSSLTGGSAAGSPGSFLFIIAKMNFECVQALAQSHFCSFEPQRHHRHAFSGFSHFTQLPVLLGLPNSLGVLCTQNHTRSPLPARRGLSAVTTSRLSSKNRSLLSGFRREVGWMCSAKIRWASSMTSRNKFRSDTNATPQQTFASN